MLTIMRGSLFGKEVESIGISRWEWPQKEQQKKRTVDLTAWHECNCCICHTATPSWEPGLCLLVWRRHGKRTDNTTKVPPNVHEIEAIVKQVSYGSGCLIFLFKSNFSGSHMCGSVDIKIKARLFYGHKQRWNESHKWLHLDINSLWFLLTGLPLLAQRQQGRPLGTQTQ